MTRTPVKTVAILDGESTLRLSKAQVAFNTLVKQIEGKRGRLAEWEVAAPLYQKKYAEELLPLFERSVAKQVEMVHCLDWVADQKGLTKADRSVIAGIIGNLAGELLAARDDPELKEIYNRHTDSDYDEEAAAHIDGLKSMIESRLGVELGDDIDMSSPEAMFQHAQAKLQEMESQRSSTQQGRAEHKAKRKKSAKQATKEAQQEAEEQQISQSIREVFRKLVSALHPDRESDPEERVRKTGLMQRVNQAYEKRNLLQLLELQLELEHIDQAMVASISDERLKHYNKVLRDQVSELDQELYFVEQGFRMQFEIRPQIRLSPATLMQSLDRERREVQQTIREIETDLLAFRDIKYVKAWLKDMRREVRRNDYYDDAY